MTSSPSNFDISQTLPVSKLTRPVGAPKNKFNGFNLDYCRVLSDDYPHKKLLTVKYNGKGNLFTLAAKGTFDLKVGTDKKETPVTGSEVKIITNIEGRNLEARFDNKGGIRLWGNFGTYTIGRPLIFTAKLKTNTAFNWWSGNLTAEYQGPQFNVFGQLAVKNGGLAYLSEKTFFKFDRFQTGYAIKFNLSNYTLSRYNFFVAYHERDFSVVGEHVSRNKSKFDLGKFILAGIYRAGGNDYILKTSYRPHKPDQQVRVKAGAVASLNRDTTLRAKINNNAKLSLSTKFRYSNNLTLLAGTQINLLDPASFATKRTIPIPLGLQLEFNYA